MTPAAASCATRATLCMALDDATLGMVAAAGRTDHDDLTAKELALRNIVGLLLQTSPDEMCDESVRSAVRAAAAKIAAAQHSLEAARTKLKEDVRRESRLRSAYKTP